MRPPILRRWSAPPSRGQGTSISRGRSPVCDPPRRPSTRNVVRIARCKTRRALGVDAGRGPGRVDAGSPERLVDEEVAEPGDPCLVHQHRLHRRGSSPPSACVELPQRERERVGAESRLVGVELDRAEPARDRAT